MPVEIRVPAAGESITEVEIGAWLKSEGESVGPDEPLVEIETDKVSMEVTAPAGGTLARILKKTGESAQPGEVIAHLEVSDAEAAVTPPPLPKPTAAPAAPPPVMPAAQRLLAGQGVRAEQVQGSGPGGRVLKEDVIRHLEQRPAAAPPQPPPTPAAEPDEEAVPMSRLRRTIAAQLVAAQQTAALLTTFNEIDMSAVSTLRQRYRDAFEKKHGVRLGFMSFFVKAVVDALKQFPILNAEVRGNDIIYKNHYDIGIAIGSGRGLVVPVLRNADRMSFAEIEKAIADFARRAQSNELKLEELQGGTFTITNGGVFGSLLSTPIVNPPQSGILGMHAIQERPVAVEGNVVIRPMMYVALTYDHRIVDGREAITFLRRIKECIEEPSRMLMEV